MPARSRQCAGFPLRSRPAEALAIVGESGCGKSVTAKTIMGLVKKPQAEVKEGSEILYKGRTSSTTAKNSGSTTGAGSAPSCSRMRWHP